MVAIHYTTAIAQTNEKLPDKLAMLMLRGAQESGLYEGLNPGEDYSAKGLLIEPQPLLGYGKSENIDDDHLFTKNVANMYHLRNQFLPQNHYKLD